MRTEVVEFAFKGDVFAELAVERAVLEGHFEGGAQAHRVEEFFARRNHPGFTALEFAFELFAQRAVDVGEIFGTKTLTVGRVGDEERGRFGVGEVANLALFDSDEIGHTGSFGIGLCGFDCAEIDVGTDDTVLESALVAVVVEDRTEQFGIKIFPILKSKLAAEHTGVDVARHEGGFHQNSARSAEGVDEVAVELPTAHLDQGGGEHFVDGGIDRGGTVAAQVEALAARVEGEGATLLRYMNIESQVRIGYADVGALSFALHKIVDNGVFHLVSDEFRVAKFGAVDGGVDDKGRIKV